MSDDLSVLFYMKDDTLYRKETDGDREKISSDIQSVVKAYDSGEVYYAKAAEEELSLSDYVIDDKKNEDAALREPEYPNTSWSDPARDTKMEAYNKAMEEYYLKQNRDYLREALKEQRIPQTSYTLCYFDGKEETIVSETFTYSSYSAAADAPVIVYEAYDQSEDISIKLSEIENIYDVSNQIMEALYTSAERYVAVGSASVDFDEEDAQDFRLSADGKTLYYFDDVPEDKYYGELYQVSVSSSGELGNPDLYDSDVFINNLHIMKDGRLLYFKDFKDGSGELYVDKEKIDYEVYSYNFNYDEDANRVTYFSDWNDEKQYGTLSTCSIGKEAEKIADDAHTFCVMPNRNVLYLSDYSLKRYQGDLYLWNNKKSEKIDEDIYAILNIY
ncbi:MAG: hypothetical protein NC434_15860 [Ruminococcus sp.]|nr:hypothetical protein [Ruminococcus sp.]